MATAAAGLGACVASGEGAESVAPVPGHEVPTDGTSRLGDPRDGHAGPPGAGDRVQGESCEDDQGCASARCAELVPGDRRCVATCVDDDDCPRSWQCQDDARGEFSQRFCHCDPGPEVCDGVDNDCDPSTPDGAADPSLGTVCTAASCDGPGPCEGVNVCGLGGLLVCQHLTPPQDLSTPHETIGTMPTVTRTVELTPDQVAEGADVKVVLIIDNSPSMAEEQARMATGLRRMVESLRAVPDLDLEFHLYTTTSYWYSGDKPTYTRRTQATWLSDGSVHPNAIQPRDWSPYEVLTTYDLAPPQNGPRILSFSSGMDAATFNASAADLEAAILAIGTRGSSRESGFCSLAQTIVGQGPNRFLHEGDTTAFIVLSDADDSWDNSSCIASQWNRYERRERERWLPTFDPTRAHVARYTLRGLHYRATYPRIDPETGAVNPTGLVSFRRFDPESAGVPNVCPATRIECPAALRAYVEAETGTLGPVTGCTYSCDAPFAASREFRVPEHDLTVDYCTQPYVVGGTSYANFEAEATSAGRAFVPGTCARVFLERVVEPYYDGVDSETRNFYNLLAGSDGRGLTNPTGALARTLPRVFGPNNYFVSTIVHHASVGPASCGDTAEQVGQHYRDFSASLGPAGHLQSICDDDYSDSLARLARFITSSVQQSFFIDLAEGERIHRVFLETGAGMLVELGPERLRIVGGSLSVVGGPPLAAGDRLRVELARD